MAPTGTPGQYSLTLYAQKTGVYRLTARYRVSGNTNWNWYSTNAPYTTANRRDFSVVVSPKRAMSMVLYELAVNNIGAQGDDQDGSLRSTLTDLYNGPGVTRLIIHFQPFQPQLCDQSWRELALA
jgi:hypothetical protein